MGMSIKEKLIKVLIKNGIISQEELDKAIKMQTERGGRLSEILVDQGFIKRENVITFLSQELGIPTMNLTKCKITPEILKLIPKKMVEHYKVLPISRMGDILTVAMVDPMDVFAIDDLKAFTGLEIGPVITTDRDMELAMEKYYGEDAHQAVDKIIEDIEEEKNIKMIQDEGKDDLDSATLLQLTQDAPVIKLANMLLTEGIKLRASDILIEPMEKKMRVRYRVDGLLQEGKSPPKNLHTAIISRLKVMSKLNIAERRLPQDGRFKVKIHDREIDFRISVLPSSFGEKAALRILDKSQAMLDINRLGFEKEALEHLKKASKMPHGMILICGPTGCGKTTTLYSALKSIDTPEQNLISVEDPVEFDLKGINQVTILPNIGLTFASSLRSILRQDPDVIMVGEIRDFDTADIAIKAALTGHMVLSTLHTTTASGSVVRLINMGVEPFLISSSVILVGAQRLIRKICPKCKVEHKPSEDMIKKAKLLNAKKPFKLYRGKGCNECKNTGYKGRVGLIECLVMTPTIRALIANKAQENELRREARKEGMKTLRENGIAKVLAGVTTLEEIFRVTTGEQETD